MRIVAKFGTSTVCDEDGRLNRAAVGDLSRQTRALRALGHEVILVSSGAVGSGSGALGRVAASLAEKQALAAVGQPLLMEAYRRAMDPLMVAQVLLTREDLDCDDRRLRSRRTMARLLDWGVVPVVNENDTVADEEIRVGDNDTLAARVAELMGADLLVLLSDIDGLYTRDPHRDPEAERIPLVTDLTPAIQALGGPGGRWGTGGMRTKLEAARICWEAGIPTVIAHGRAEDVLLAAAEGTAVGTRFVPTV
ncbi:Glutamate 5-kinase [Candidatus Hydrogenisulfobacillus filiaventi]|uniref:Glutamate 5-kinase n=1 Tax=Candidatus Hydrogenisulfobacillus filiaventi TaxID=2707344 RepID=A0A6F8ZH52_9FIRM|nr:glutamate 5-kinase [Bacillota bacterium]CAB1129043.1 Glutamate 5-kinase [Candidatus Hydrogenisulfobacillus filiaventi]